MKNIFSYNKDVDKNAYMNWRTHRHRYIYNMIIIAEGFMKSSIILAEQAIKDNHDKKADILVYPIVFNANHAIELYLKAITWTLNVLLGKNKKIEGKHNIKQTYSVVNARVMEFEKDKEKKKQFKKLTVNLNNYLNELFEKIESQSEGKIKDNMDFSRYPCSTQYVNHFYIDEFNNVVID